MKYSLTHMTPFQKTSKMSWLAGRQLCTEVQGTEPALLCGGHSQVAITAGRASPKGPLCMCKGHDYTVGTLYLFLCAAVPCIFTLRIGGSCHSNSTR
jgi:hypothetical protein